MRNNNLIRRLACATATLLPLCLSEPLSAQTTAYLRGGLSADWSKNTLFKDRDCASTQPPALFGCALGNDGRELAARGDFDRSIGVEAALGYRVNRLLRLEGMLHYRDDLDFSGQANFRNVNGPQPVRAAASALSAFALLYADFPVPGRLQPYAGLGIGVSYNRIGTVHYGFPSLAPTAATLSPSGSNTDRAWLLTAGAALPLAQRLLLDLAYRYTDLGAVETDSGTATIIRSTGTRFLDIDATGAAVRSEGVVLSLRYHF